MPKTPVANPIQLPEVLYLIANVLDRGDCARCARVSKLWHYSFLIGVWGREIQFGKGCTPEPTHESIQSHAHLVRSVYIVLGDGLRQHHGFVFPSLKSLAINVHASYSQNAADLVLAHPTVVHLTLQNMDRHQLLLWHSIAKFTHLKILHIWFMTIHPDTVENFLVVCARLEELKLFHVSILRGTEPLGTRTFPMMKRLRLAGRKELPDIELLQSCPNLRALGWSALKTSNPSSLQEFKRLICAGTWPQLESLLSTDYLDDENLVTVLSRLNKITSLNLSGQFGPKCFAVLRRHVSTIEILNFDRCDPDMLTAEMLKEIRSTCPLLKRMKHPSNIKC